ncbi:glycosyltransferase family 2 protein [Litoreibacter sp.]|nr:glycosyltransferase family 2 protein [Litoreibacter sp.]
MSERYLILTCMKNEGPFILEWVAYHLSIGFDHMLIYTNDCEDGTDKILNRLERMGVVTHRDNTRGKGQRPAHQVRAFRKAPREQIYKDSDWVAVIDADEFINVHTGDRTISALTNAAPDANCISLTWRLFGSGDQTFFNDGFVTEKLRRAAPLHCPSPMQAWGMKTIHRTDAVDIIGCHRPRTVPADDWPALGWVNGCGQPMPASYHTGNWRMTRETAGYELAQVNHYAIRTRENYLMKAVRGRAYTPDMLGADYWHKMNRNEEEDTTIQSLLPDAKDAYDALLADPVLHKLHLKAVTWHRNAIDRVAKTEMGHALMNAITPKMELFGHKREAVTA